MYQHHGSNLGYACSPIKNPFDAAILQEPRLHVALAVVLSEPVYAPYFKMRAPIRPSVQSGHYCLRGGGHNLHLLALDVTFLNFRTRSDQNLRNFIRFFGSLDPASVDDSKKLHFYEKE